MNLLRATVVAAFAVAFLPASAQALGTSSATLDVLPITQQAETTDVNFRHRGFRHRGGFKKSFSNRRSFKRHGFVDRRTRGFRSRSFRRGSSSNFRRFDRGFGRGFNGRGFGGGRIGGGGHGGHH